MKKLLVLLLAFVLSLGFSACGGDQSGQTKDFDAGTVEIKENGYTILVPGAWPLTEKESARGFLAEDGDKRSVLLLFYIASDSEVLDAGLANFILSSLSERMDDVSMIAQEDKENANGAPYLYASYLGGIGERRIAVEMTLFHTAEGVLTVAMYKELGSKKDFTYDFTKVIDSVVID